jgi:hypothetical protein
MKDINKEVPLRLCEYEGCNNLGEIDVKILKGGVKKKYRRRHCTTHKRILQGVKPLYNLNDPNLAYMAGFFDGEGCISVSLAKGDRWSKYGFMSFICTVSNVDKAPLELFEKYFGGRLAPNFVSRRLKNCSDVWSWTVTNKGVSKFLKTMHFFCKVKKKNISLAIEYYNLVKTIKWKRNLDHIDPKVFERCKEIYKELKINNKRGKGRIVL